MTMEGTPMSWEPQVGQLVVCINDTWDGGLDWHPVKGSVYRVSSVHLLESGMIVSTNRGLIRHIGGTLLVIELEEYPAAGWMARWFRPITDMQQEIVRSLLAPAPAPKIGLPLEVVR